MGKAAVKDSGEAGHQLKEDGGKGTALQTGNDGTGVSFVGNAEGRERNWECSRDGRTEKQNKTKKTRGRRIQLTS